MHQTFAIAFILFVLAVSCVQDKPNTAQSTEENTSNNTEKKVVLRVGRDTILIGKDSVYIDKSGLYFDTIAEDYLYNPMKKDTIFALKTADPFFSYLYNASEADMISWRNAFIGHAPSTDTSAGIYLEIQKATDTFSIFLSDTPIDRYKTPAHEFFNSLDRVYQKYLKK
jgi:hypothetical protein